MAWGKVLGNGGAAGGDGITCAMFGRRAGPALAQLSESLRSGDYHPRPCRDVDIPKRSGGTRRLTIPAIIDRIAQTAVATALVPPIDAEFEDASFAYRVGRGVDQAIARLQLLRGDGFGHVVDADISGYFDAIPHDGLLARLAESLTSGPTTELIALWLTAAAPCGRGVAQGSPLSPLLANLYLDRLDEAFSSRDMRIVRFADDFVVVTRNAGDADAALTRVERLLAELGLALNRDKTRVTDFDRGFRFLGHQLIGSFALKSGSADRDNPDMLLAIAARQDEATEARAIKTADAETDAIAHGYAPGLRTLYVLEKGRRLNIRNQAFAVEERQASNKDWAELIAIPHQRIDRIETGPGIAITPAAMDHAAATGVVIAMVDGRGATRCWMAPKLAPRAGRHLAQAATVLDPTKRLRLARIIVCGRLHNQRNLLRKLLRERVPAPPAAVRAIASISTILGHGGNGRIEQAASVAAVMGYEGQATAAYWPAISALAHPDFGFVTRRRRPAPDVANIALNMLASLLARDIGMAVLAADLHPGFGALHESDDQHDAAVYDLMEEFRGHMVEGLFVYVSNRRILRADMFSAGIGGLRMASAGTAALIRAYETRASSLVASTSRGGARKVSLRQRMIEQAQRLAAHHEGRSDYVPYEIPF